MGDPQQLVADCGIAEPLDDFRLVALQGDPFRALDGRDHVAVHEDFQQLHEQRLAQGLMDPAKAAQDGRIGQEHMRCVQQASLGRLEHPDVVPEAHSGTLKRGAPGAEPVLDHPLGEVLAEGGHGIGQAALGIEAFAVGGSHPRRDTVDHAVRQCHVGLDPIRQAGVTGAGERGDGKPRGVAVVLEVVALQHGERRQPGRPSAEQRLDDEAEGGPRRLAGRSCTTSSVSSRNKALASSML